MPLRGASEDQLFRQLGAGTGYKQFCGIPFTDFWAEEMGIAFSSIEKKARILTMPIVTSPDLVHFCI